MKIVITGGAGYLGSVLIREFLNKLENFKFIVIDNFLYGSKSLPKNKRVKVVNLDLCSSEKLSSALLDADAVIHLAGIVGDPACSLNSKRVSEINTKTTSNVACMAKAMGVKHFIFASSCSVYGFAEEQVDETSQLNPISTYAQDKIDSENLLSVIHEEGKFQVTILRMGTLFGPSYRPRFDLVVNLLTAKAKVDNEITIFGGKQIRPFVDVRDAANAYISALLDSTTNSFPSAVVYNVGSMQNTLRITSAGKIIQSLVPKSEYILDNTKEDNRNYDVCFDKIKTNLSFRPKYNIEDGVNDLLYYYDIQNYQDSIYHNHKWLEENHKEFLKL